LTQFPKALLKSFDFRIEQLPSQIIFGTFGTFQYLLGLLSAFGTVPLD
jgi:hypothetical protein